MCCSRMWFTDVQKRSDHVMNANFHSFGKIKEYDYITQYTKDWTFINYIILTKDLLKCFINMDNLSNYYDTSVYSFVEMNCNFDKMNKLQFLHLNFIIKAWFLYWLGTTYNNRIEKNIRNNIKQNVLYQKEINQIDNVILWKTNGTWLFSFFRATFSF